MCQERHGNEAIPGCPGSGGNVLSGYDYCVEAKTMSYSSKTSFGVHAGTNLGKCVRIFLCSAFSLTDSLFFHHNPQDERTRVCITNA